MCTCSDAKVEYCSHFKVVLLLLNFIISAKLSNTLSHKKAYVRVRTIELLSFHVKHASKTCKYFANQEICKRNITENRLPYAILCS